MFSRLLRQLSLFILSMASSIVVGWLLMDQMERKRREIEALEQEIPPLRSNAEMKTTEATGRTASTKPVAPEVASTTRKSNKADDLTIIEGIGPAYAKALNAIEIKTFAELAAQNADDLASRMQTRVTADRIRQDDWIGQAKQLSS
jgi:predicted flap endonuclease-1-like 5' DNA nuclease